MGKAKAALVGLMALTAVAVMSGPAASSARVSTGTFHVFAGGLDIPDLAHIAGHARMIRTTDRWGNGITIVTVDAWGLTPGVTYLSHVHKASCSDGDADGHYKFDPNGPSAPPNEIWPGPFTANAAGRVHGFTRVLGVAAPEAQSIVIHNPDKTKIACADLR